MSSYGYITPESTNDGRMKKTEMNTACAEFRAMVETKTPDAERGEHEGQRDQREPEPAAPGPEAEEQRRCRGW